MRKVVDMVYYNGWYTEWDLGEVHFSSLSTSPSLEEVERIFGSDAGCGCTGCISSMSSTVHIEIELEQRCANLIGVARTRIF